MSAKRKVAVELEVAAAGARREIRGTAADVDKLIRSTEVAGESLDDMASEAAQAGRKLDDMADEAAQAARATDKLAAGARISGKNLKDMKNELGRLDGQIDQTVAHLKLLEHQFAQTGDKSLLKQIRSQQSLIAQLRKIRKDLTPDQLPAKDVLDMIPMNGVAIGVATVAASALAAPIGAAIAGAVIGGVGVGGVVGGIVAAAHDGRVKDAYGELGHGLALSLKEAGRPFLGPLIHEVTDLGVAGHKGINILHDGFEKLAPVLRPLVLGLGGFVDKIGPGLSKTFTAAAPAVRALANELPEIGEALGDMLATLGEDDRATEGLIGLLHVTEDLIYVTGQFIGTLEYEYDQLVGLGTELDKLKDRAGPFAASWGFGFNYLTDEATDTRKAFKQALDTSDDYSHSLEGTADSAEEAAEKIKDLNDAIESQLGIVLGVREAQIRFKEKWDDATKAIRDNIKAHEDGARSLDRSTKAGRENEQLLIDLIKAADGVRDAKYRETGSLDEANKAYDAQLGRLRDMAINLGIEKKKVDELIDSVRSEVLKKGINVGVSTPGLPTAQARLDKVEATLNRLDGSHAVATVLIQELHREEYRQYAGRRWGGITEHAATGTLRDAAIYRPPTRYAFAEPATGGEAFVPKRGDYGRSMSILSAAASWYGASVVPHRMAGGGASVVEHRHVLVVEGTGVLAGLRQEIGLLGGDVQNALGSRTRVGG